MAEPLIVVGTYRVSGRPMQHQHQGRGGWFPPHRWHLQTTEGCGNHPTAMQDAFDEFGLPETAFVTGRFGGLDHEDRAPLS